MRSVFPGALAAAVSSVLAWSGAAAAPVAHGATRHPVKRCRSLHGTDLSRSHVIKVVAGRTADGYAALRGCVRPDGVIRMFDRAQDEGLGSSSVSFDGYAGTWVRSSFRGSNQYGGDETVTVTDLRTGRAYAAFTTFYTMGEPGPPTSLARMILDAHGRAAVALETATYDIGQHRVPVDEQIAAFAPDGTKITIDSGPAADIPAASLTFRDGVLSWQHGGVTRTARFG